MRNIQHYFIVIDRVGLLIYFLDAIFTADRIEDKIGITRMELTTIVLLGFI